MQLEHALEVVGARDKEMRGEDFLENGAHARQGEGACGVPLPFDLQEGVGEGGEHRMAVPAWPRAAFKVVKPEFIFEFLLLRFDGPAVVREADEPAQRGRRREGDQVVLGARRRAAIPFRE